MVPLLSVRVTNNTEKTFNMFSKDPSRSLTLCQHCTRHAQWATNVSMWARLPPRHSPYIDMLRSLPRKNWHGHLSLTDGPLAQFPPNKLSILWNHLENPMCLRLVCVSLEWRILDFIISQISCLCSPFRHTRSDNIARVQSQRTWQTWTCTPRLQLHIKLCLMRLSLSEEFLRTFSYPLLSLHLKWPLWIRYRCVVLICYRFC